MVVQASARLPRNAEHAMTCGQGRVQRQCMMGLVMWLFLAGIPGNVSFAQETSVAPLTADQVVRTMVERNEQRRQTAMGPKNYEFRLVTYERTGDQGFYILEVTPRIKNKFLFRGRIWVDGQDFAVASMEGE